MELTGKAVFTNVTVKTLQPVTMSRDSVSAWGGRGPTAKNPALGESTARVVRDLANAEATFPVTS